MFGNTLFSVDTHSYQLKLQRKVIDIERAWNQHKHFLFYLPDLDI